VPLRIGQHYTSSSTFICLAEVAIVEEPVIHTALAGHHLTQAWAVSRLVDPCFLHRHLPCLAEIGTRCLCVPWPREIQVAKVAVEGLSPSAG
jgi:hypothetical protein